MRAAHPESAGGSRAAPGRGAGFPRSPRRYAFGSGRRDAEGGRPATGRGGNAVNASPHDGRIRIGRRSPRPAPDRPDPYTRAAVRAALPGIPFRRRSYTLRPWQCPPVSRTPRHRLVSICNSR